MIGLLITIIKTLFPDRTRVLIGLLTLFLCLAAVVLIEYLEIGANLPTTLLPVLLKGLSVSLLLILGLSTLLLVTSFRSRTPHFKEARLKDLSKVALDILKVFGQEEVGVWLTTEQLSTAFSMPSNQCQLALDQLLSYRQLDSVDSHLDETKYTLNRKGRSFLGKNNLL